jgi:polyferredoxin/formate hydrogenlyase subunit 6/NADH:ubiquinone oxidoreductase subunit I
MRKPGRVKLLRVTSQALFFGLFAYVFIRSLDPFSTVDNPFLTSDPLVLLTHLQVELPWLIALAGLLVLALVLGRAFCGWICPLGGLVDGLDAALAPARRLLGMEKRIRGRRTWLISSPVSWLLLGAVLATLPFTPPLLQFLHPNVWLIRIFSLTPLGIAFAGMLVAFSLLTRRLWCTYACPLGALYGLLGKVSLLRLGITRCADCGRCDRCPTRAADYRARRVLDHQCILCFDFEAGCPVNGLRLLRRGRPASTQETLPAKRPAARARQPAATVPERTPAPSPLPEPAPPSRSLSRDGAPQPGRGDPPRTGRRELLRQGGLLAGGVLTGALLSVLSERGGLLRSLAGYVPELPGGGDLPPAGDGPDPGPAGEPGTGELYPGAADIHHAGLPRGPVIRPPGVLDEERFAQRCLRCFQCVRSCPNRIIKISPLSGDPASAFTPRILYEEYGCDYYCQVCQQVCPNYAIPLQPLELKQRTPMGFARIHEERCVVYAEGTNCLVCEEFCPVPEKAIKVVTETRVVDGRETELRLPVMDLSLCIGCGVCQVNCPVVPDRAITVETI